MSSEVFLVFQINLKLFQHNICPADRTVVFDSHHVATTRNIFGIPFQGIVAGPCILANKRCNHGTIGIHNGDYSPASRFQFKANGCSAKPLQCCRSILIQIRLLYLGCKLVCLFDIDSVQRFSGNRRLRFYQSSVLQYGYKLLVIFCRTCVGFKFLSIEFGLVTIPRLDTLAFQILYRNLSAAKRCR